MFRYAVAQNYSIFWANQQTDSLMEGEPFIDGDGDNGAAGMSSLVCCV